MDLKSMKDRFLEKAQNELVEKIEEGKQDISKRSGETSGEQPSASAASLAQDDDPSKVAGTIPVATGSFATEQSIDQTDQTQLAATPEADADSSEDADKGKDEAA